MANDSSTGGYLLPDVVSPAPQPVEDAALVDFLQECIVGLSGIKGQYVRPRWQPEPPNLPRNNTDWVAFGIESREPDTFGVVEHHSPAHPDPRDQGYDELIRHETIQLRCSFYGPHADSKAAQVRDGLLIAQNREALFLAGMGLVETGYPVAVPTLVKQRWLYRVDMTVSIRREIRRTYPVLNLLSAHGSIISESVTVPFNVVTEP